MKRKPSLLTKGLPSRKLIGGGAMAGATILGGVLDGLDPADEYGVKNNVGSTASGALSGAMAGSALGPYGIAAGAIIGGVTSFLGNKKAEQVRAEAFKRKVTQGKEQIADSVEARQAANPALKFGNMNSRMFGLGGTIKGKPAGKFNLSMRIPTASGQAPDLLPNVAISPGKMGKKLSGGYIESTSSKTGLVKGKSHAEGGVKIPELGVELEGKETVNDEGFVFSHHLGFAKTHEKIGKALGNLEKRDSTPLVENTKKALDRKEGILKIQQEETKRSMGLPNEVDATVKGIKHEQATVKMAFGGPIKGKPKTLPAWANVKVDKKPFYQVVKDIKDEKSFIASSTSGMQPMQSKGMLASSMKAPVINPTKVAVPPSSSKLSKNIRNLRFDLKDAWNKTDVNAGLEKVAPFASNIANAFRRLPQPPKQIIDDTLTPGLVNYDADRVEAVKQRRGADKAAEANLGTGAAISASKAANLTGQIGAMNKINQEETNTNTGIKNQFAQLNANIKASNNNKRTLENTQQVERQLKQQELDSENVANVGDKMQAIQRDKAAAALDDDRMILTMASANNSAALRAGDAILKRRLSSEGYKQMTAVRDRLDTAEGEDLKILQGQARSILSSTNSDSKTILADGKFRKGLLSNEYTEKKIATKKGN